jgi:hypothetical protein
MLNDFDVNLGSDLIQGSKKYWMRMLNDFEVKMGSDLILHPKKKCNENAKWLRSKNGEWFDLKVKKNIQCEC